mgnify:CR=1 FL=1
MSKQLFDWNKPAVIVKNNFKFKSLSDWSFNTAVGCAHACRFCYVPSVSTGKGAMAAKLRSMGVADPDADWGSYVAVRPWHESVFMRSLYEANDKPLAELSADGNRAVMFSTTTDPYQVLAGESGEKHMTLVRRALSAISSLSTLNVRILTRSPLARKDFPLMKTFGNRLMFGMSLPTLNDRLARIYEPHAPSPTARLNCLRAAHEAGLNIFVAVAPTYPECDVRDMERTLRAIAPLNPLTVFMEPINIRAENIERIRKHAESIGETVNMSPFASPSSQRSYAISSLLDMTFAAKLAGLESRLHLWPDSALGSKVALEEIAKAYPSEGYATHLHWLQNCWNRVSEWPGKP